MLMKNRKLYQMLAVTAGVLLLSGCGASSAQETGITSSDPQEPTTISEETKRSTVFTAKRPERSVPI